MTWKPDVTVAALVERDGRFLMVEERVGSRLVINQPAGHLEPAESLPAAVIRETLEETAWQFTPQAIVGVYLWQAPPHAGHPARCFLRIAFAGTVSHHDPGRALDAGIERTLWLSRQQLAGQPAKLRSPLVLRCIDDHLAGIRYPLELLGFLTEDAMPVAGRNQHAGS